MIPIVVLRIPGDVITGVMLGAFMIHGLRQRPLYLQKTLNSLALFIGMLFSLHFYNFAGKDLLLLYFPVLASLSLNEFYLPSIFGVIDFWLLIAGFHQFL